MKKGDYLCSFLDDKAGIWCMLSVVRCGTSKKKRVKDS